MNGDGKSVRAPLPRYTPTVEWTGTALRLLDQRLLPGRVRHIVCGTVDELCDAIRTLAVRGAPAIGIAAAYGAVLAALESPPGEGFAERVSALLDRIASTRPTAVNLFSSIASQRRILSVCQGREEAVAALAEGAGRLVEEDLEASAAMGREGARLLPGRCSILTHCNAGGLATAGLGTALAVAYEAFEQGLLERVYADETRPLLQGARLTAWELSRRGIPVTVLPDSAAATVLSGGLVAAVFTGADRIAANGDTANKIGTFPLALAARAAGVPFYIVAPLTTFDPKCPDGGSIPVEQRPRGEVEFSGRRRMTPRGVDIFNPAFDITPEALISAIVCEKGVLRKPFRDGIAELTP